MTTALFVPCYVDQFFPHVAIAALTVLERLGVRVDVPEGAACCGQPSANAGYAREGHSTLERFVDVYAQYDRVVVLSGSCAVHVRQHAGEVVAHGGADEAGARVAERTTELCAFLHDEIGVQRVAELGASFRKRVAVHIGCHALRGMGLARPSELQVRPFDKVRALLGAVRGVEIAELARPDECCGFGGTFAVAEPDISAKMGRDRLRDYRGHDAQAVVSTDVSCLMHLSGLARRERIGLPMYHVAELLAGTAGVA
ncbi:MAG TPA: (Fe-S)-binding protein [Gemmatimonadaceae bacterium]|jgi:L-lactate dehydrogenase complex protein LldE|nr:(Fe-S)-binding protein [Gemmatimonadaceae bacterium]